MTATIFTLKNANFNNPNLPNILPFVNQSNLDFAYDFKSRPNRLNDLTGRHADLVPIKVDKAANQVGMIDPTIISDLDGDGIKVTLGHLKTDIALAPIDLSQSFTVIVIGGNGDAGLPSNKVVGANPNRANLIDFGTAISNLGGFCIDTMASTRHIGARVSAGTHNLVASHNGPAFIALTYKDGAWTLHNKTNNTIVTKTNAELGIKGNMLAVNTAAVSHVVMGHFLERSTLAALPVALYQVARWNEALTEEEIEKQYQFSKNSITSIRI